MHPFTPDNTDRRDPFAALERQLHDMVRRYLAGALDADQGESRVFGYHAESGPDGIRIEAFGDPDSVRAVRADPGGPGEAADDSRIMPGGIDPEMGPSAQRGPAAEPTAAPKASREWQAPTRVDVRQDDHHVHVAVEVPGVPADAIEGEAVRDRLAVTAIAPGVRYREEVHLPEVDPDSLQVATEDGRLVARLDRV